MTSLFGFDQGREREASLTKMKKGISEKLKDALYFGDSTILSCQHLQ